MPAPPVPQPRLRDAASRVQYTPLQAREKEPAGNCCVTEHERVRPGGRGQTRPPRQTSGAQAVTAAGRAVTRLPCGTTSTRACGPKRSSAAATAASTQSNGVMHMLRTTSAGNSETR